jgi:hypothetical protein
MLSLLWQVRVHCTPRARADGAAAAADRMLAETVAGPPPPSAACVRPRITASTAGV